MPTCGKMTPTKTFFFPFLDKTFFPLSLSKIGPEKRLFISKESQSKKKIMTFIFRVLIHLFCIHDVLFDVAYFHYAEREMSENVAKKK